MGRRDRRAEKRKKRRVVISLSIVFLMVFGFTLAGVVMNNPMGNSQQANQQQPSQQDLTYGDYEFEIQNNYYVTEADGRQIRMLFHPASTLSVQVPEEAKTALGETQAFAVTFDPYSEDVQYTELARFQMMTNLNKQIYGGVTRNSSEYNQPIITCEEATTSNIVVLFNSSNSTSINYDNGCIVVNANAENIVRAGDRLIYEIAGVI